jgi:hypothetical protein
VLTRAPGHRHALAARTLVVLAICVAASAAIGTTPAPAQSGVILSLAPVPTLSNPAPGTPELTWSTGNGAPGRVTVTPRGGGETVFASGPEGTEPAPWIVPGREYLFRLYSSVGTSRLLATLRVGHEVSTQLVTPPASPPNTPGWFNTLLAICAFGLLALLGVLALLAIRQARGDV